MITLDDLEAAIAECEGERNPNANTCIKLAAYYTILNEKQGKPPVYSYSAEPVSPVKETVDYYSETEFGQAIQGKDLPYVMELIDELMTVLQTVQPRLYSGVMSHL
jgi:hypothetical protein